jgi:hypothetical protein
MFWGGVKQAGRAYCSDNCAQGDNLHQIIQQIPPHVIDRAAADFQKGACPECQGPGPIEFFESHNVYSFFVMSRWTSTPHVCCKSCANQKAGSAIAVTLVTGWWGIPWGLVMTPVQIARNIGTLAKQIEVGTPSPMLRDTVARLMAVQALEAGAAQPGGKRQNKSPIIEQA